MNTFLGLLWFIIGLSFLFKFFTPTLYQVAGMVAFSISVTYLSRK